MLICRWMKVIVDFLNVKIKLRIIHDINHFFNNILLIFMFILVASFWDNLECI